ncbi:MAG TPA: hypothetical protein VFR71_07750 [Methyloceanibacter sp.]|jgi:hypothetical protein|nr:hypothetical protein [Methyloceanibacter sp.]
MRQGKAHRHAVLVAEARTEAVQLARRHAGFDHGVIPGFSLLRLSVPARLAIVAAAAAVLWLAVLWALG